MYILTRRGSARDKRGPGSKLAYHLAAEQARMGKQLNAAVSKPTREQWLQCLAGLIDDVVAWSEAEGWPVERGRKHVADDTFDPYDAPTAAVRVPGGQIRVEPVGVDVVGAEGRVDVEAWPTLNRVKLLRRGDRWIIFTDSNVPLRERWGKDSYVQLARDLMA